MPRWDVTPQTGLAEILLRPEARPNYLLAAKLGVAPTRLSEWSRRRREIPADKLMLLCEILNVSPEDVVRDLPPINI